MLRRLYACLGYIWRLAVATYTWPHLAECNGNMVVDDDGIGECTFPLLHVSVRTEIPRQSWCVCPLGDYLEAGLLLEFQRG
jgi:hypothetical protein